MTGMDDLTTWLRAQMDYDELLAQRVAPNQAPLDLRAAVTREGSEPFLIVDSKRMLAEIDAKRRIIDAIERRLDRREPDGGWESAGAETDGMADTTLRLLALPYADRPGYRSEWAP